MAKEKEIAVSISEKMKPISKKIHKIISDVATTSETSALFWTRINRRLKEQYTEARKIFRNIAPNKFIKYYNEEVRKELKRLNKMNEMKGRRVNISDFLKKRVNEQTKFSVISDTVNIYEIGLNSGEKNMLRLTAQTQKYNLTKKEIEDFILPKDYTKRLRSALDNKYITITDKKGVLRNYNIKSYTDMLVRTQLREASTAGVINTAAEVNSDLVQVSSHNTATPICQEFEGKVFSLSGKDKDFPTATLLSPFHPNCLHSISVIFRSVIERRGIQQYKDFATGKTEMHPTRTSHIPVSKRGK